MARSAYVQEIPRLCSRWAQAVAQAAEALRIGLQKGSVAFDGLAVTDCGRERGVVALQKRVRLWGFG